jgi:hypothetical protein
MPSFQMRSCLRKRPYESESEARSIVKSIRKAGVMSDYMKIRPYKCLFCPHWHVGHERKR